MAYFLIVIFVAFCFCIFCAVKADNRAKPRYSQIAKSRKSNHTFVPSTKGKETSSKRQGLSVDFKIKVHKTERQTQPLLENDFHTSAQMRMRTDDGVYLVGVAEQMRRLGGKLKRNATWEDAVADMRMLAGVDDIPPVFNLTRKIDQGMYRKIKKLGGDPQPDWSYFESKIYISRLEKGITSPFRPVLLERYDDAFADWFYRKSGAWSEDVRELPKDPAATIRFEVGRVYVQTEYPPLATPYFVKCIENTSGKVKFRFAKWVGNDDDIQRIKVKKGVEVAGGYRADYMIEERSLKDKEKLTHWTIDFNAMEKPKKEKASTKKSKSRAKTEQC